DQWRSLLNRFFTMRIMEAQAQGVARIARRLLDPLRAGTDADWVTAFNKPFPGLVFFELILGLSGEQLQHCSDLVQLPMDFDHPQGQAAGFQGLFDFTTELVTQRRAPPGDGSLVDAVARARPGGQPARLEDSVSVLTMLILGGLETTSNTLGHVL